MKLTAVVYTILEHQLKLVVVYGIPIMDISRNGTTKLAATLFKGFLESSLNALREITSM